MPRTAKLLTAAQRRNAEHKAFLRTLQSMQKVNIKLSETIVKQATMMDRFLKSYEVDSPPTSRVMSDEREWLLEQEEHAELAREMGDLHPLPNPFLLMGDDG